MRAVIVGFDKVPSSAQKPVVIQLHPGNVTHHISPVVISSVLTLILCHELIYVY